MALLRILPRNVADMIAAGEVVQRPASVVKELMENALDAGATRVSVLVTDAGRTLIRVIDDGAGMSPDDAVLCFERHATSKIAAPEDLQRIQTYGFRGEALASIAAVSEVTLRTRRPSDEVGCEVVMAASEHRSTREVSAPTGSDFSVRNLFYNIPARRKFLKSDNVELRHIIEEFTRIALTRPDVSFDLRSGDRELFSLKPVQSLKFRILALLGTTVVGDVVDVTADTSVVRLSGYAGRPEAARKTAGNQYFFVNGRYFRSPYLAKAVQKAYEGLIPDGAFPTWFLYLETDPDRVDVNISPTKSEVKFEDDSLVFQVVYAAVKEAVGRYSATFGNLDFDSLPSDTLPTVGRQFEEYRQLSQPASPADPSFNPFEMDAPAGEGAKAEEGYTVWRACPPPDRGRGRGPAETSSREAGTQETLGGAGVSGANGVPPYGVTFGATAPSGFRQAGGDYAPLFDDPGYGRLREQTIASAPQMLVLKGRFLVTPSASGMMVVHVRRAMERILYERFIKAFQANEPVTQTVLFPVRIPIGVERRLLFDEHAALLKSLGFDIVPFGEDSIVVNGVPQGYSAEEGAIREMVTDLEIALSDAPATLPQTVLGSLAEKFAMLGAAHADAPASATAAQNLLEGLLATENPERTSSGRRIIATIPLDELEKRFQV